MEALIGIFLFGALLAWILFDMYQVRKNTPKEINQPSGWPNVLVERKSMAKAGLALVAAIYLMAIDYWINPPSPPFTGRRSTLKSALYYSLGPESISLFWGLVATVLLIFFLRTILKKGKSP